MVNFKVIICEDFWCEKNERAFYIEPPKLYLFLVPEERDEIAFLQYYFYFCSFRALALPGILAVLVNDDPALVSHATTAIGRKKK